MVSAPYSNILIILYALHAMESNCNYFTCARLRNSVIAEKLMITESILRTHIRATSQKLQIDRRTRLAEKLK